METCHYCGVEYHPMVIWTRGYAQIYVCDDPVKRLFLSLRREFISTDDPKHNESECYKKAIADGYVMRRDLTPTR